MDLLIAKLEALLYVDLLKLTFLQDSYIHMLRKFHWVLKTPLLIIKNSLWEVFHRYVCPPISYFLHKFFAFMVRISERHLWRWAWNWTLSPYALQRFMHLCPVLWHLTGSYTCPLHPFVFAVYWFLNFLLLEIVIERSCSKPFYSTTSLFLR